MAPNILEIANVTEKVENLEAQLRALLETPPTTRQRVPQSPARDIKVQDYVVKNPKLGLATPMGQARLLHDLANIELQAMELGVRTLIEYPDAPRNFRQELAQIVRDESRHLRLCLGALDSVEHRWGDFHCHTHLWDAVKGGEELITRILIVHRYLEGSGLDASSGLLRKLSGVKGPAPLFHAVTTIAKEEEAHVAFGSRWFKALCIEAGLNPECEFRRRLQALRDQIPKRSAKVNKEARLKSGFSEAEIYALAELNIDVDQVNGRSQTHKSTQAMS